MASLPLVPLERPAVLRFGEWVVYPRLCRATRAGSPVHLRSQVMDLLVILARHPHDILSRDVLSAALWPGVHVSGSGLSRCMAELRDVFDDDPRNPWLVETIAKRGYRLIAPVQVEGHVVETVAERSCETTASTAPRDTQVVVERPSHLRWWPRRLLWASGAAAAAAIAATWLTAGATKGTAPTRSSHDTVMLGDVVNHTGDQSFDGAVRLALALHLEQAPFLRVLSEARVREAASHLQKSAGEPIVGVTALDVCRREGGAIALSGSLSKLGSRFALGLEAITCTDGEVVARVMEQASGADDVLDAVGRAATTLRTRLGESLASMRPARVPLA